MFSHFFGGHYVSELNLIQASISPSLGGFGLRFFPAYHKAAYLASMLQCSPSLKELCSPNEYLLLEENVKTQYDNLHMELGESLPSLEKLTENANSKLQSTISEVIDQVMIDKIMKSIKITIRDKARIMGCSTKYAAAWMSSAPNSKKGKFLDNQAFGLLLCYWFGLPIFANNSKCHCGSTMDKFGDHAIHCKKKGNLTRRHDHVRDILYSFLQAASIPARKEVLGYFAGKKSRVGDLVLPFGGSGLNSESECLYDVTIHSSLYIQRIQNSSEKREYTAEMAVRSKLRDRKADEDNMIETSCGKRSFIPLGFEALGGFSSNSKKFVDFIATVWSQKTGITKSIAKHAIVSKLSFGIQRGNALCLAAATCASITHDLDEMHVEYPY
jgi:hypothetical protein